MLGAIAAQYLEPGCLDKLIKALCRGGAGAAIWKKARLLVGKCHHKGRINVGRLRRAHDGFGQPARHAHLIEHEYLVCADTTVQRSWSNPRAKIRGGAHGVIYGWR